jgi:hypothetical protein
MCLASDEIPASRIRLYGCGVALALIPRDDPLILRLVYEVIGAVLQGDWLVIGLSSGSTVEDGAHDLCCDELRVSNDLEAASQPALGGVRCWGGATKSDIDRSRHRSSLGRVRGGVALTRARDLDRLDSDGQSRLWVSSGGGSCCPARNIPRRRGLVAASYASVHEQGDCCSADSDCSLMAFGLHATLLSQHFLSGGLPFNRPALEKPRAAVSTDKAWSRRGPVDRDSKGLKDLVRVHGVSNREDRAFCEDPD